MDKPWIEVARRAQNQSLFVVEATAETIRQGHVARFHGFTFNPQTYRHFDGARWYRKKDKQGWIDALKKGETAEPWFLMKTAQKLVGSFDDLRNTADQLASENYVDADSNNLCDAFSRFWKAQTIPHAAVYDYMFLNTFYPEQLLAKIATQVPDVRKQNRLFMQLTQTDEKSELKLEQEALATLAQDARIQGVESTEINERIREHTKRWGYLNRYFYYKTDFTESEIRIRLERAMQNQLTAPAPEEQDHEPEWEDDVQLMARTIRKFAYASNYEYETYAYTASKLQPLFNAIARKLGVSMMQLVHMRRNEIINGLQNGLPEALYTEAAQRAENVALVLENGAIRVFEGAKLKEYAQKEKAETPDYRHVKELVGQAACPGCVEGTACILRDARQNDRLKKGQVLIAPTTYPAMVPAMERAAAIVTDEGGLLSHAAIVSRELGVPCIVGTKIATAVIEDGQRILVDANAGIVKKL